MLVDIQEPARAVRIKLDTELRAAAAWHSRERTLTLRGVPAHAQNTSTAKVAYMAVAGLEASILVVARNKAGRLAENTIAYMA